MVMSMTGFACKTVNLPIDDGNKVNLTINIKSLNSRFFETTFKLPYALSHLETDLIKLLKTKLIRGHIHFTIHISNQSALKGSVEPSLNTIQGYVDAVNKIKKELPISGDFTLTSLLQLPNIFSVEEKQIDQATNAFIIQTVNELVQVLIQAKQEESLTLEADLLQRTAIMEKEIANIEKASIVLLEEQKNKVAKALQEIEADESKLAETRKNALYALLDKMDIHEETVRFKSHLKSLIVLIQSKESEKGKRLDFTLQELGREINTIAAKCSDAQIGTRAIDVKVELEKAREQAQNIV